MLVKASIAGIAAICAVVSLSRVDFRELYNEMYPVNGLRRDVLSLCHQAEPTFVRAVEADRIGCYDSMPDPVERAIDWVRTSSRLAALRRPSPIEVAEKLLLSSVAGGRFEPPAGSRFTGYAAIPGGAVAACGDAAQGTLTASDDRSMRRFAAGEAAPFAALGLPRVGRSGVPHETDLPVLPLGGAGDSTPPDNPQGMASAVDLGGDPGGDPRGDPGGDPGGDTASLLAPRVAASACKTPV